MDIRTRKTKFLESLDSTEVIRKAVSLAIDCIIDNHNSNEDTPLVITSYDDLCRIQVLNYVQEFCEAAFPDMDEYYFSPKEGANKRGNSSRLTQSFHFFMFEPIFSPVNALNQPI